MPLRFAACLLGVIASTGSAGAGAMGLGAASVNSSLGEPLRLSFPVSSRSDEDVGCVTVRPKGDDLPSVLNARTSVIRNGFQTRVEVRSAQPIEEPAIGLVVSVGCVAPISREYVVFLDPPVIAPLAAASEATDVPPAPARNPVRRPAARRPQAAAVEPSRRGGGVAARGSAARKPRTQSAAPRPPRLQAQAAPAPAADVGPAPSAAARNPATVVPAPSPAPTRDRLTVAPSEAQPAATAAAIPPVASGSPPATAGVGGAIVPVQPPAVAAGTPAIPVVADAGEAAASREQALRQQQADLQQQIKALSDQIAALRVQTTSLVTRNETLERSSFSPVLIWLLIALAVIAIAVAGWMAWRYTQLRRSIEGSAWWTANTTHAVEVDPLDEADTRDGLPPLDPPTRMPPRVVMPTDVRTSATAVPQTAAIVSNLERSRPVAARNNRYPAAIDTDFTVSDIEAAMATVRTVSPPRDQPRPKPVEDSDFAPLGGPTLPSPYAEPPPPSRGSKVVERDGDDIGKFVDLEIPPLPAARRQGAMTRMPGPVVADPFDPAPKRPVSSAPGPAEAEIAPLDFKLDIPHAFDPLATDSMKTTIVDRTDPANAVDLELSSAPTPLDFELPSATAFATTETGSDRFAGDPPVRHGATALDDLFPALGGLGPDTILDLDERHGSPLSTTEVDRLLTTAIDGSNTSVGEASTRARMARFADLMNQVDDAAVSDPLRAIAHLRQFVLRDEQIPTLLWLRLFELYKAVDKKPVYEALAEHFSRRYHRPMVGWTQTLADRVPQTPLSAMGGIDREIEAQWGKDEGLERIRSLLCDRDQDDAVVFNAVLQRDLLDAAKVFPPSDGSPAGNAAV